MLCPSPALTWWCGVEWRRGANSGLIAGPGCGREKVERARGVEDGVGLEVASVEESWTVHDMVFACLEAGVALGVAARGAAGADDDHASALAAAGARHLGVGSWFEGGGGVFWSLIDLSLKMRVDVVIVCK